MKGHEMLLYSRETMVAQLKMFPQTNVKPAPIL